MGTDGVLLGALCAAENARYVLEVGTGSGLIALMIAQRNPQAKILGIDIAAEAVQLAQINFGKSNYTTRLVAQHVDYKCFRSTEKFDFIVCNPPFFEPNDSRKDKIARQTVEIDPTSFMAKSSEILAEEGQISIIIPSAQSENYISCAKRCKLFLKRKIDIFGIENGDMKRNVLEFSFMEDQVQYETFIIEKSPRKYSDQYLELTKEFHVFRK